MKRTPLVPKTAVLAGEVKASCSASVIFADMLAKVPTRFGRPRASSFIAALVGAALLPSAIAYAAEVKITDCDGTPRAIREVRDGTPTSVEIRVTDKAGAPLSDVGFTLSPSSAASEALTALVVEGKGGFKNVSPGAWKICQEATTTTAKADAIVSQVAVITNEEQGTTSAAAWLGGAGVAVTGIGLGVFSGRDSSESAVPASTGGNTDEGSNDASTAPLLPAEDNKNSDGNDSNGASGPGKKSGDDKIACPATEDCLNDERPDPLDPISPSS